MKLTPEDIQATKALRQMRVEEKRTAKELNQVGKRISWCREKLELAQRQVCEATGIPPSSYCGREAGIRTEMLEEYLVLAVFFNREWQQKFSRSSAPFYEGKEIRKITPDWLMFGVNDAEEQAEILIQEYRISLQELESNYFYREQELKRQLSLFSLEEQL